MLLCQILAYIIYGWHRLPEIEMPAVRDATQFGNTSSQRILIFSLFIVFSGSTFSVIQKNKQKDHNTY